jgi:hypothetical protein
MIDIPLGTLKFSKEIEQSMVSVVRPFWVFENAAEKVEQAIEGWWM